jgi:hypothetical protein
MVTEYPGGQNAAARGIPAAGGVSSGEAIELPYAWPPARGRAGIWVVRVVLLPIFVGIAYVFANYPVDRFFVHTETGLVVTDRQGESATIGLTDAPGRPSW